MVADKAGYMVADMVDDMEKDMVVDPKLTRLECLLSFASLF